MEDGVEEKLGWSVRLLVEMRRCQDCPFTSVDKVITTSGLCLLEVFFNSASFVFLCSVLAILQ